MVDDHSNVFMGLALDKVHQPDDSIRAYQVAVNARRAEPLAWQGLLGLYERQDQQKVDEYQQTAVRLAEIYKEVWATGYGMSCHIGPKLILLFRQR